MCARANGDVEVTCGDVEVTCGDVEVTCGDVAANYIIVYQYCYYALVYMYMCGRLSVCSVCVCACVCVCVYVCVFTHIHACMGMHTSEFSVALFAM